MHGKHALRALVLSLMATLGLMAFTAVSAQAENLKPPFTHGKIKVEGKETNVTFSGKSEGVSKLLVPALGVEISCSETLISEGTISTEGHGVEELLLRVCNVYGVNASGELTSKTVPPEALPCELLDSKTGKATHITLNALTLIVLHEKRVYIIYEQLNLQETVPLATVKYTSGTGCPIPLKQEIKGRFVLEVNSGDLNTGGEVVEPLISGGSQATQELFTSQLVYGTNLMRWDTVITWFLDITHIGSKWGFI